MTLSDGHSSKGKHTAVLEFARPARVIRELMKVELTPNQRAFVQKAIESGRFSREEEAVQEALALWEERERRRLEIIAMIDEADASLARGEGREFTRETTQALADDIKQCLRRRIAAERSATSR
jgi:putative addiction module CopG family antidote